ncbi:MAG: cytidylyltransferase domain-containing protein [Nitrospirales bacterium]
MAWQGQRILAVVPARGGSKGIPRKNLCKVGGKSLIAHAAQTVQALSWIDRAILSTDDEEMAEEGRTHGLDVPFLRPADLAGDEASSVGMWQHAWLQSEEQYKSRFEISILLQPTTPLRQPEEVEQTVRALVEGNHQAAATVSPVPGHFTPQKILTIDHAGCLNFFCEDGAQHSLRQTSSPYFSRNGLCYAVTRENLIDKGYIVEHDCVGVVLNRYIVNIDDPFELELANFLFQRDQKAQEERP